MQVKISSLLEKVNTLNQVNQDSFAQDKGTTLNSDLYGLPADSGIKPWAKEMTDPISEDYELATGRLSNGDHFIKPIAMNINEGQPDVTFENVNPDPRSIPSDYFAQQPSYQPIVTQSSAIEPFDYEAYSNLRSNNINDQYSGGTGTRELIDPYNQTYEPRVTFDMRQQQEEPSYRSHLEPMSFDQDYGTFNPKKTATQQNMRSRKLSEPKT